MNFYNENLELLKNKIIPLYETVVYEKETQNIELEMIEENLNLIVTLGEKRCFIHSLFNIEEEMKQMFRKVDADVSTLIIFGMGCGYALSFIKETYKNIKNLLIIEPSVDIFKVFLQNINLNDELKKYEGVTFIVNKNVHNTSNLMFQYIKGKIGKSIYIVYNLSYRTIFNDYYEIMEKTLVENINKTTINLVTNTYFKEQWTYNPIKNLNYKAMLINDLFDKFKEKTAFIVSAGPSLNKNMHLIEKAKDKALIAAVGTASKILESNNIKPHFRFAMDSQKEEKLIFQNIKEDNSILVFSDRVYHEVVPLFNRRLRMILDLDYLTQYIYAKSNIDFETIKSGFSIANTALYTLIKMGFKNIVFLGQDMCYTQDKLYAAGSWLDKDNIDVNDGKFKYIKTKDIYGNEVYTEEGFLGIKSIFEILIASNSEVNYINATEGGVGLKGTKIKTLQQVLNEDLLDEYDYDAFFEEFFRKKKFEDHGLNNIIFELDRKIDVMLDINEARLKKIKKIDGYLEKNIGIKRIEQETASLNKFEEELKRMDAYNNCVKYIMNDIYKVLLLKNKYEGTDRMEAIIHSKNTLQNISYELKQYLTFLKNCIKENWINENNN